MIFKWNTSIITMGVFFLRIFVHEKLGLTLDISNEDKQVRDINFYVHKTM